MRTRAKAKCLMSHGVDVGVDHKPRRYGFGVETNTEIMNIVF